MATTSQALKSLFPTAQWGMANDDYNTLQWFDTNTTKPTKAEAKRRIAESDWSVLPDVGISNVAQFETYRASLRELIKNPVANPSFPTEPEPVWL